MRKLPLAWPLVSSRPRRGRILALAATLALLAAALAPGGAALAQEPGCELLPDFASLRDRIERSEARLTVGDCQEPVAYDADGDGWQRTTFGLFVYRSSDGWIGFSDGEFTWHAAADGLVKTDNYLDFPQQFEQALGIAPGANYLFVLTAQAGTLEPVPGGDDSYILTVANPSRQVSVFSDHPNRHLFQQPIFNFLDLWEEMRFDVIPPSAALVIADAAEDADVFVLELRGPVRSLNDEVVTFLVRVRRPGDSAAPSLAYFADREDPTLPEAFGPFSLFVDSAG